MAKKYDAISLAQTRFKAALENQRQKFEKFNDFDHIFHSKLKKYDPAVPSKVFNPIVWSFIETIVTRMLAKKPTIGYKPREDTDDEQAQIVSDLFSYWFDKAGAYVILLNLIKQALVYGTGIVKVDWYTSPPRTVKSYQVNPITGEAMFDPETGQYVIKEETVVDYDDPRIQNVNIYDFFFDPAATSIEDADWVIHQYYTTIDKLEGMKLFAPAALKRLRDASESNNEDDTFEAERRSALGYAANTTKRSKDKVRVWEMWADNKVCYIANEDIVLYEGENPYWHGRKPFIRLVDSANTLEFYGKGEIEPVEKMLHALNTLINQRITNISQILSPIWKAKANIDETELQFIPNSVIHVADMQDADIMKQQDVTASSFQEQSLITETIQRTLGVTDYVQGLQTPGQTAAEVNIKTAQANQRFSHKVSLFEEMALKQLGEMVYALYQQFITTEKIIRVLGQEGEKFVRLTPADLVGRYDVIPESGSSLDVDQEDEFKKFLNLASFMVGKPYVNQYEIDHELFERAGEKDVDKFFIMGGANAAAIGQLQSAFGQTAGAPAPVPQPRR